jgi:hypothetical protein
MMDPRSRAPCPAPPAAPRRVGPLTAAAPLAGTPRPESLSSCQARRCRRRVRTTTTGRTRTPSIGSTSTLRPRWARLRSLFTRVASPRTLSLAASPVPPRQGQVGRFELPRVPAAASPSPARGPRSLRGRCVSPTSATDSRHEHPAVRSIPGCAPIRAAPRGATRLRARTHPGREPRRQSSGACRSAYRMSRPGGASLDGEPPASALPQPPREPRRASAWSRGPGRPRARVSAVLVEPRSTAPPRCTSRRRCSRPHAGLATRPLTSPVVSLGGSGIAAASPSPPDTRTGSAAVSSKTTACADPGRLPSTSAPSPGHARRLRACAWDHEEPATGVAARVLVAFATATRLPAPVHLLSSPA